MFKRKNDYLDEPRELPGIVKGLLILFVLGGLVFGIVKFCEWSDREDMKMQYPDEYVNFE